MFSEILDHAVFRDNGDNDDRSQIFCKNPRHLFALRGRSVKIPAPACPDLAVLYNVIHTSITMHSEPFIKRQYFNWIRPNSRTNRQRQSRRFSVSLLAFSRAHYCIKDHAGNVSSSFLHPISSPSPSFSLFPFLIFLSSAPSCFPFRVFYSLQQIAERITVNTELSLFILISSDICIISYSVFTKIYISLFQHFGYWKPIVK